MYAPYTLKEKEKLSVDSPLIGENNESVRYVGLFVCVGYIIAKCFRACVTASEKMSLFQRRISREICSLKDVNRLHVLVCSLWRLAEQPPAVLQSITCAINAVARMGWNATVPWGSSHGGIFFNEAKWTASFSSGVEGCMCTGQHHIIVVKVEAFL